MLKYEVIDNQKEEWVVFVHGIGGSTKTWGKQIDEFSENYNLLLLDLPGHGLNADTIILGGPSLKLNSVSKAAVICANKIKGTVPYEFLYQFFAWFMMPKKNHETSRKIFLREVVKLDKETMYAWIEYLQWVLDPDKFLKKLDVLGKKVLFISGKEDHCFVSGAKAIVKKAKNMELKIIDKCGHICSIENWKTFNQLALDHLKLHKQRKEPEAVN